MAVDELDCTNFLHRVSGQYRYAIGVALVIAWVELASKPQGNAQWLDQPRGFVLTE
uniref:Uncharacterized protein n=1 Tax=uncultured Spirochaetales bacterium HF0500_06B09 TaxID=710994 RepID=E0XY92_9SPIR|nr:hypothetical protein [uncultured Spirochaetales bacterium HF0500_06B09]